MFSLWSVCRQLALVSRLEGETSNDVSTLIEQLLLPRQRFHEAPDLNGHNGQQCSDILGRN